MSEILEAAQNQVRAGHAPSDLVQKLKEGPPGLVTVVKFQIMTDVILSARKTRENPREIIENAQSKPSLKSFLDFASYTHRHLDDIWPWIRGKNWDIWENSIPLMFNTAARAIEFAIQLDEPARSLKELAESAGVTLEYIQDEKAQEDHLSLQDDFIKAGYEEVWPYFLEPRKSPLMPWDLEGGDPSQKQAFFHRLQCFENRYEAFDLASTIARKSWGLGKESSFATKHGHLTLALKEFREQHPDEEQPDFSNRSIVLPADPLRWAACYALALKYGGSEIAGGIIADMFDLIVDTARPLVKECNPEMERKPRARDKKVAMFKAVAEHASTERLLALANHRQPE